MVFFFLAGDEGSGAAGSKAQPGSRSRESNSIYNCQVTIWWLSMDIATKA